MELIAAKQCPNFKH